MSLKRIQNVESVLKRIQNVNRMLELNNHLDVWDRAIFAGRVAAYQNLSDCTPVVGDYVIFADGTIRRVSHVHFRRDVQTSDLTGTFAGRFYLQSDGHMNYSGGLHPPVSVDSLTLVEEKRPGSAWFFRHDLHRAFNGVDVVLECRVWMCDHSATGY